MSPSLPVLILTATRMELEVLRKESKAEPVTGGCTPTFAGSLAGVEVFLSPSGVGKSAAAFTAGLLLAGRSYRALVNVGCAGAFPGAGLSMGEVVIADREIFTDEGTLTPAGFLDLEQLSLPAASIDPESPAGAPGAVYNLVPIRLPLRLGAAEADGLSKALGFPVRVGPLSTASTCSGTAARAREVAGRWGPLAESMEGAALALAALRMGLPFLEVRGISNFTGDRDRGSWQIGLAVERASAAAAHLIAAPLPPRPSTGRWDAP